MEMHWPGAFFVFSVFWKKKECLLLSHLATLKCEIDVEMVDINVIKGNNGQLFFRLSRN